MSSGGDFDYSSDVQQSVIGASVNASMLLNFTMGMQHNFSIRPITILSLICHMLQLGIYTIVYGGTMYLYISRKAANIHRRVILCSISLLYLLCMIVFIIQWYYLDLALVINGDTRVSIFNATIEGGPTWIFLLFQFFFYAVFVVSDGLLIWRCYHVWDMSWRIVAIPLILFLAEFCLFVTVTIMAATFTVITSTTDATIVDNIASAQVFISFGITVTTSSLIAYRVHCASRLTGAHSKRAFSHLLSIVLESAAVYALVVFVYAILSPMPSGLSAGSTLSISEYYLSPIVSVVAGMAPTILVARIAVNSSQNSTIRSITHIPGLQFDSQGRTQSISDPTEGEQLGTRINHPESVHKDEEKIIQ